MIVLEWKDIEWQSEIESYKERMKEEAERST